MKLMQSYVQSTAHLCNTVTPKSHNLSMYFLHTVVTDLSGNSTALNVIQKYMKNSMSLLR